MLFRSDASRVAHDQPQVPRDASQVAHDRRRGRTQVQRGEYPYLHARGQDQVGETLTVPTEC